MADSIVTAPITSARVRELRTQAEIVSALSPEPARNRIAKALSLLERVEAGDAGLVEAMSEAAYNADVGACEEIETRIRAALSAAVKWEGK